MVVKEREQQESQRQIFNAEFSTYKSYKLEDWRKAYIGRVFKSLAFNKNDVFLDIGVGGSGYTVIEAAKLGAEAFGIDISEQGIKKAQKSARKVLAKEEQDRCHFVTAPAEELPFEDAYFTKVCSIALLEHVVEDYKVIEEISRVLKPGGLAYICVPNNYAFTPFPLDIMNKINDKKVGHLRHYDPTSLIKRFERRGFEPQELIYHGHRIKILQWLIGWLFPKFRLPYRRLWWKIEAMDQNLKNNPYSMNFSIVLRKKE